MTSALGADIVRETVERWRITRMRRSAAYTPANVHQLDEARLELHIEGTIARAEIVWANGYGSRMIGYGSYIDVQRINFEVASYGVGCGPVTSSRPHQWQHFSCDDSDRAFTTRGEARVLSTPAGFVVLHVMIDGGVGWCGRFDTRNAALQAALPLVNGDRRPRWAVRVRGRRIELTVASMPGVLAYCHLDPDTDLLVIPISRDHAALVIVADDPIRLAELPVAELGQREPLWSDEPAKPRPPPGRAEPPNAASPSPRRSMDGVRPSPGPRATSEPSAPAGRRPGRCNIDPQLLDFVCREIDAVKDHRPTSHRDPASFCGKMLEQLCALFRKLAERGQDLCGLGRQLRDDAEKKLGKKLEGSMRSFRYALTCFACHSPFVRREGARREAVCRFSDLRDPDSAMSRYLYQKYGGGGDEIEEEFDASADARPPREAPWTRAQVAYHPSPSSVPSSSAPSDPPHSGPMAPPSDPPRSAPKVTYFSDDTPRPLTPEEREMIARNPPMSGKEVDAWLAAQNAKGASEGDLDAFAEEYDEYDDEDDYDPNAELTEAEIRELEEDRPGEEPLPIKPLPIPRYEYLKNPLDGSPLTRARYNAALKERKRVRAEQARQRRKSETPLDN